MTRAFAFIFLFAGAAWAAEPGLVLSSDGLGPLKIGMTYDRVAAVVRQKIADSPFGCTVLTTKALEPVGISFVIDTKALTRINVEFYGTDPRPLEVKTEAGIGLTSSEEDLLKAYAGRTRIDANPMDPSWHTIYVDDPDHERALVFETNGKTVKSMRSGQYPAVAGHSGCD